MSSPTNYQVRRAMFAAFFVFMGSSAGYAQDYNYDSENNQQTSPQAPPAYSYPSPSTREVAVPRGEPLEKMVARNLRSRSSETTRGAGFYVDWDGHVVTASHVALGCRALTVKDHTGAQIDAIIVGADTSRDIALLRTASTLATPLNVEAYTYSGITEVNAVASMQAKGRENVVRVTLTGLIDLGDSSVMRVVPVLSSGVSGAPLLDNRGNVIGVVVGRWGSASKGESISVSGKKITEFLGFHRIRRLLPASTGNQLFGRDKSRNIGWQDLRKSVVSVECKGT